MNNFWKGKSVFITGHTGFKGSWLCLWLHALGAVVSGYALKPPTKPSLFELARVGELVDSPIGDVRDRQALDEALRRANPEIVFHMAAQPLVRDSYMIPVETYETNVMGTIHLFEGVRGCNNVKAIVNVTTDKCYENREWPWGYRENEPLGGYDPYSSSKACSELVTAAYRSSFFNPTRFDEHGVALASARAGNVIGGGDWAADRLVPDCIQSLLRGEPIRIRSPHAVRPWQHVLEPLSGYLLLARKLVEKGTDFAEAWNFGPREDDARPVEWIVRRICQKWGGKAAYEIERGKHPHEASHLKLDWSKARGALGWEPRWRLDKAIDSVVDWARANQRGEDMRTVCLNQIEEYASAARGEA